MTVDVYLFCGIPGTHKLSCLKRIRAHALSRYSLTRIATDSLNSDELENEYKRRIPIYEYPPYDSQYVDVSIPQVRRKMSDHMNEIRSRIERQTIGDANVKCIFIHSHLSFHLNGDFYTWMSTIPKGEYFGKLLNIKQIIVFIDNLFSHKVATEKFHIPINELCLWRDVELAFADTMSAMVVETPKFGNGADLLAINHSLDTVCDLLFNKVKRRVYLAFPITQIRRWQNISTKKKKAQNVLKQNISFRRFMSEKFLAFDPSTIDEVLFRFDSRKLDKKSALSNTHISPDELWPVSCDSDQTISAKKYETVKVPTNELSDFVRERELELNDSYSDGKKVAKSVAWRSIRSRDIRLIEQSEGIIIFRPTLKGKWSDGVREEFRYAQFRSKPVCILRDDSDGPLFPSNAAPMQQEIQSAEIFQGNLNSPSNRKKMFENAANWMNKALKPITNVS